MKRYRLLLQILCMLIANCLFAETGERSLVILMKSGTTICLPVSNQPKILFDGTVMHVDDGDYQIENVQKWIIGTEEDIAAGLPIKQNSERAFVYKESRLTVGRHQEVHIFNASGIEIPVQLKDGQVDMTAWPAGVYMVKAGTETFKLRKR